MKKLFVFAMVATALTIFSGCQKEEQVLIDDQQQEAVKPDVYVEDGILVFSDRNKLNETLNSFSNISEGERRLWEKKLGFTSQLTIFNDIVDAELKLDEPYQNMSLEELKNVTPPPVHSELYFKYLKKGLIKEYNEKDGEIYDYSTCAPYLVSILDVDGIFIVGDTMYQYSSRASKEWVGYDIDMKQKLISTNESTNEIKVKLPLKSSTVSYGSWMYDYERKRRIRIGINFNSYKYYADGTVWNYTHWVEVQSQKKNFWGNWKYNLTTMTLTGHWDYSINYGNPYYQEGIFQNSAGYFNYPTPYVVYASNLKGTCCISTGTVYPYGSIMSAMTDGTRDTGSFMQEDLKVIYDVVLDNYYWEVTGHSYVTATVSN